MISKGVVDANGILLYVVSGSDEAGVNRSVQGKTAYNIANPAALAGSLKWNGTTFVKNAVAAVVLTLDDMLETIDNERETLMMQQLTAGGAKKYEYAEKAREVRDYATLGGTVTGQLLAPLNVASTKVRFSWAMAESLETGDSLDTVIARYSTAINNTELAKKIAARAQKLKRALRAATAAARPALFAARSWPTS